MNNTAKMLVYLVIAYACYRIWDYYSLPYRSVQEVVQQPEDADSRPLGPLPGMDRSLEDAYREAKGKGVTGLKAFLDQYGGSKWLKDPRYADMQLDYVLLVGVTSPEEAKQVYAEVEKRVKPGSPVYARMRELRKSFR